MVRIGSRKLISGFRDVRKGQNCAADPLGALPDPKTAIKVAKMDENVENLENGGFLGFLYISYCPVWAL